MRQWATEEAEEDLGTDPNATTRPPLSFTADCLQPGHILCSMSTRAMGGRAGRGRRVDGGPGGGDATMGGMGYETAEMLFA